MIPKLIHYSWFSGEPYPQFLQECMDTWKKVLPDYEFMLWDAEKLAACNNTFANEAVSVRKWAFAADFVRLYAVYHYGGIWLDTDVEMFKSFDPFLNDGMFIGRESYIAHQEGQDIVDFTSHCFGAEKNHPFIKECLEFYEHRHFIRSFNPNLNPMLRFDTTVIPLLQVNLARTYGFDWSPQKNELQILSNGVHVYPFQYFDRPCYEGMKDVVCIHRVVHSWYIERKVLPDDYYKLTNPMKKDLRYYVRSYLAKPIISFLMRI